MRINPSDVSTSLYGEELNPAKRKRNKSLLRSTLTKDVDALSMHPIGGEFRTVRTSFNPHPRKKRSKKSSLNQDVSSSNASLNRLQNSLKSPIHRNDDTTFGFKEVHHPNPGYRHPSPRSTDPSFPPNVIGEYIVNSMNEYDPLPDGGSFTFRQGDLPSSVNNLLKDSLGNTDSSKKDSQDIHQTFKHFQSSLYGCISDGGNLMNQNSSPFSFPLIGFPLKGTSNDGRLGEDSRNSERLRSLPDTEDDGRFKPFHEEKWNDHLQQLRGFKNVHGHCLVPHTFPDNQNLARWVKRQRRQYKLMLAGKRNSTMTKDRVRILNREGFIWDSHEVVWRERYAQLAEYKKKHGHTRVPSYCKKNPQLASWVKCQRRQYKLFWEGKRSSMNGERTQLLNNLGFTWEVKAQKKNNDDFQKLAQVLNDL